jgi:DNA-binding NarL/FixJ family response regulator
MDEIRLLIADDQPLVRTGLRSLFDSSRDIKVIAEAANGVQAVAAAGRLRPNVVLMDINMPRMDGVSATMEIRKCDSEYRTKIVILTMYDQDENVFSALRAGASGFILKDSPTEKLLDAVRAAATGNALLSPSINRRLIEEFARRPPPGTSAKPQLSRLTDRERDVFNLLVRGYRNDDIARSLVLGESTVKSHVQHLYQKLGVRDRVQVVIYAYENGLV